MLPLPSFRDVGSALQVVDEAEGLKKLRGGSRRLKQRETRQVCRLMTLFAPLGHPSHQQHATTDYYHKFDQISNANSLQMLIASKPKMGQLHQHATSTFDPHRCLSIPPSDTSPTDMQHAT